VLDVTRVIGEEIHTTVKVGGELSNNKGINRQGGGLTAPALTEKDMEDIKTAMALGADFVAVSFPKNATDMEMARQLANIAGAPYGIKPKMIAKIERAEAIPALQGILDASDGIMVARGDLAVEVGNAAVPALQKRMIRMARESNKFVITATQMMESMIQNPVPTRAEVSDVANAVMDGTDAVMLSAETATGRYPLKAVEAMADVIRGAEKYQFGHARPRQREEGLFQGTEEAIAMAVMYAANHMNLKAIVALTETGATTLWMSRLRSDIPIYAFTRNESTGRRVTMYRGVYPVIFDVVGCNTVEAMYNAIFARLVELELVREGDMVIVTKGELSGVQGGTNSMQILKVHLT
jgi:pyruvate kinase